MKDCFKHLHSDSFGKDKDTLIIVTTFILPEPGLAELPFFHNRIVDTSHILCHALDHTAVQNRFHTCTVSSFDRGPLTPSRPDLFSLARSINLSDDIFLIRDENKPWGWDAYITAVGLMGASSIRLVSQSGETAISPPGKPDMETAESLLLIASGGIGNVVQTTPLLVAAQRAGLAVSFCPLFDGGGSLASLFDDTLPDLNLVSPDTVDSVVADIRINIEARDHIRDGDLFHSPYREPVTRSESQAYMQFFLNCTGLEARANDAFIGGRDTPIDDSLKGRIILCPGSKPHWDSKRWPHFGELARRLGNPVILCRQSDVEAHLSVDFLQPLEASSATMVTNASLAEAAAILHHATGVIANDCGLAHMAAAAGTPTLALFGPTSMEKNQPQGTCVKSLSLGLDCQPCQGKTDGPGYLLGPDRYDCSLGYRCMAELTVDHVLKEAESFLNRTGQTTEKTSCTEN